MDDKIVYPFKKNDGFVRPCFKGCPNCCHADEIFWDYSHGVYAVTCQLHDVHDIICPDYENDGTKPVTIEEFNRMKEKEMEVWNGVYGQTIVPAGTFEEIYNNYIESEDDI